MVAFIFLFLFRGLNSLNTVNTFWWQVYANTKVGKMLKNFVVMRKAQIPWGSWFPPHIGNETITITIMMADVSDPMLEIFWLSSFFIQQTGEMRMTRMSSQNCGERVSSGASG